MRGDRRGSQPSESTDDDSISITSTVPSVKKEEYFIEGIIAERDNDGITEYLARWEGYPDERCTWEIRSHFTDVTLLDWETQKMRVARGRAEPYNVEALLDRVEEWISATMQRKSRRRAKRLRLGLLATSTEDTLKDQDESYAEAEESSSDEEHDVDSLASETSVKSKGANLADSLGQSSSKENRLSSNGPTAPVAKMARNRTEEDISGYLHDVPGAQSLEPNQMQGPGKAPTAIMFRPQKRDGGSAGSKSLSASSGTSPIDTSFSQAGNARQHDQATGLPKKRSSTTKSSPTKSKVGIDGRGSLSENHSPETEQASKLSSASSPKHALPAVRRASLADPDSLRKVRKELSLSNPVSPAIQNPRRGSLSQSSSKPTTKSSKTPSRSAKSVSKNLTGTMQTPMGGSSRGPARLSLSKSKSTTTSSKKAGVSGAAILSNWNKAPKRRKSNAFQPGSSDKPSQKFSTVRKYEKRGRNEPAPNIEMLTFMNLKNGGVAKQSSRTIPKLNPPKTPYQLIQEGLKADANDPPQTRGTKKPLPAPNNDDESRCTDSLNLKTGQSTNSKVPDSNLSPIDPIPASSLEAPTSPGRSIEKQPLSVSKYHLEGNPGSVQPSLDLNSTAKDEISKALPTLDVAHTHDALPAPQDASPVQDTLPDQDALPTQDFLPAKDASVTPRAPHMESGFSDAHQSTSISASLQDKPAFPTQPAPWSKGTSYSRSYAPTQTASSIPYGPTTLAQKNSATPVQTQLINSGVEKYDILGNILIEQDGKDLGDVRFRGMDRPAGQLFLTIKVPPRQVHVVCKNICTIGEYQEFYRGESNDYISSGFVLPFWPSFGPVWDMAEMLKSQASAAIFYSENFSLVIYPNDAGLESWDFRNNLQRPVPEGTLLRFMMRKPLPPPPPPPDPVDFDSTGKETLLSSSESKSNINIVFQEMLGIEYERLIKQPTPERTAKSDHFFLLFVGVEKEFSLMCRFLAANGAKIYSWEDEGAWDYFCAHIETGVVLIEGSFYQLYLIPKLSRLLAKPISVFNITFYADKLAPHPHINRLFPHGQAILITDSFLLLHPQEAARFLHWFRWGVLDVKPPGQWKLCLRPGIRDLLLSMIEEKSEEDGCVFMQMYESLWYIIPEDQVDDEDLEDDLVLDTDLDEKPVRCMSSSVSNFDQSVGMNVVPSEPLNEDRIGRNDATLVEWFAGWAMTQLESFRRFIVVSGSKPGRLERERTEWEGKWSHICVLDRETAFGWYKIAAWEREFEEKKTKGEVRKKKDEVRKDKDKGKQKERKEAGQTPKTGMHGGSTVEKTPVSA